jgi:hypothetical protein
MFKGARYYIDATVFEVDGEYAYFKVGTKLRALRNRLGVVRTDRCRLVINEDGSIRYGWKNGRRIDRCK